jgi:hypothetical protein
MDKTIDMAREVKATAYTNRHYPDRTTYTFGPEQLKAFEALVRADEREACAKFCESNQVWVGQGKRGFSEWGEEDFVTGGRHQGMDYAAAIRARGNT